MAAEWDRSLTTMLEEREVFVSVAHLQQRHFLCESEE